MRITIVTRKLSGRGGIETAIRALAEAASHRPGVDVSVELMGIPDDTAWLQGLTYRVHHIDQGSGKRCQLVLKLPWYTRALRQMMTERPPDIVLATEPIFVRAALRARRRSSHTPRVMSWLHFSLGSIAHIPYLIPADGHLAISTEIRTQILNLGALRSPVVVFNPLPSIPDLPRRTPNFDPVLAYVGRIQNRQKRFDVMLQGLAQLKALPWRLEMVGDGTDLEQVKFWARDLGIADRIQWHGWCARPWEEIADARALLLTSDYEGFPMVLLEGLVRGIPVIATDCPTGPRDIVSPGDNGYLVPPHNVEALKTRLAAFLLQEPPLRWEPAEMRRRVIAGFHQDVVFDRMMRALAPSNTV